MQPRMKRFTTLALTAFALGLGVALVAPTTLRADAVDDQIAQIGDLAKQKGEEGKLVAAIDAIDGTEARYLKALTKLLKHKDDRVAAAAYRKGAEAGDKSFFKKLTKAAGDKKLQKERSTVYVAALDGLGISRDPKAMEPLEDVVKKFMATNPEYSTAAIKAYCMIREPGVIDTCIKWLTQIASTARASGVSKETRDNNAKAEAAIFEGIEGLTGVGIADAGSLSEWWEKSREGYEFPTGEVAALDPAPLAEFEDPVYGMYVKKPDAPTIVEAGQPGWTFQKGRADDVRLDLRWRDETKYETVWIEFRILNTTKNPQKKPMELVKWWIEDWKNKQYSELRHDPEPEEVTIGGREWVKSYVKGMSSGSLGPIEDFLYVTQQDHLLYYATIRMRLGSTPDEIRDLAVKAVEEMEIRK